MVYVDNARIPYRRMLMCHMLADSVDELHAMADRIGVDRRHFQDKPGRPHYDICYTKRALAVQQGAKKVTRRELVNVLWRLRPTNPCPYCTIAMTKFINEYGGRGLQHPPTACSISKVIFTETEWDRIFNQESNNADINS